MVIGLLIDLFKNNLKKIYFLLNNIIIMKHYTKTYTLMIYIFHIIFVAIPLLYYGFGGQQGKTTDMFGYVVLSLLGGMALVFHGYWLVDRIIQKCRKRNSQKIKH